MKILQVTYSLTSGGAERLVVDLSNELSNYNEVHLLTILDDEIGDNSFYKNLLSENIHYHCAKESPGMSLKKLSNIYSLIDKIAPDIVHIHGAGIIYYVGFSIVLNKKPLYFETLHTDAIDIFSSWYSKVIIKYLFKFDLIKMITISDINKLGLEKISDIRNSSLIYNGRSNPVASINLEQVKNEIEGFKNNSNDIVFIHVGRSSENKNQKMLIEVFNELEIKAIGCVLLILGEGFELNNAKELREKANANIHFLGTKLNVIDYFLCSDAFCLTSFVEGMPISLIEAFACECVPICTPTSGCLDIIIDGENGFVSENFTKKSYINTIERYIKIKRSFKKSVLRETYLYKFSMEKCSKLYYQLYQNSLN